uniref:Uncharacterized protein LOC102805029 n=1 Tax=Saccoglossus kowalevskii TaxID=10224 RepID=A0ABM0LYH8_SACKO|nr:PREDICTED: uncharacterized protein LOC102805029 [Saccoglossus kowalevskii]
MAFRIIYALFTTAYYIRFIGIVFYLVQVYTLESVVQECDRHVFTYKVTLINGDVKCVPCTKCPAGFGVVTECRGEQDTQCEICAEGTYSAGTSLTSPCKPCKTCPSHLATTRNCTRTQNVKCARECDHAYFKNILTDDCSPCSWCFPNNHEVSTPVIQECVIQGMPRNYQCMPSNVGGDVPTYEEYKAHIESNYQHDLYVQKLQNKSEPAKVTVMSSSELSVTISDPVHSSVSVAVVIIPCFAVIGIILACIALIIYVCRSNNKALHSYDNIGECYTSNSENCDVERRDAKYHSNPIELSTFLEYLPIIQDSVPGSDVVSCGGKHADTRRFIESESL